MNKLKIALASLAVAGAAVVAAPEPATAQGFSISFGVGHPGYYGYGYHPAYYGYGYRRPWRRVVVHRPYYPAYYHRPYVRRVVYRYHRPYVRRVVYGYPRYYRRPVIRRVVYRSYPRFYGHRRAYYGRPHHVRFVGYGGRRHYGGWRHHRRWR